MGDAFPVFFCRVRCSRGHPWLRRRASRRLGRRAKWTDGMSAPVRPVRKTRAEHAGFVHKSFADRPVEFWAKDGKRSRPS